MPCPLPLSHAPAESAEAGRVSWGLAASGWGWEQGHDPGWQPHRCPWVLLGRVGWTGVCWGATGGMDAHHDGRISSGMLLLASWILFDGQAFAGEQHVLSEGEYPTLSAMGCLSSTAIRSLKKVPVVSATSTGAETPQEPPFSPSMGPPVLALQPWSPSAPMGARSSCMAPSRFMSSPILQFFSEPSIFLHGLECFEGKEIELNNEVRSLQAEGFNNHVLSVRVKGGM